MKKKMLMRLMTATLAMSMLIQSNFGPVASMFPYYLPNVVFASEDSNSDTSLSELESVDIEIEEVETSTDSSVSSELLEPENEEQSSSLNVDDSVNNDENQSSETEESNEGDENNDNNNGEENSPLESTSSPVLNDSEPTENVQVPTESPVPTELPNQDTENKTEFDGTIEPTLTPSPIPTTEASDMVEQVLPSVSPSATPTATIAAGDFVLENKEQVVLEEQIISADLKAASVVVKGNLPEGAVVNVVELNTEDYLPLLAKYYGVPVENVFCTAVLDITIENENEVFQPKAHDETVEVTIENIEAADAQQDVLHLEGTEANDQNEVNNAEIVENINVEQIELVGTVADESTSACFETESFSIYVIGGVEYDSEDGIYLENEYATAYLFDDGTLYVESFLQNGAAMMDYPWGSYADDITSVSFSDTITFIGDYAFDYLSKNSSNLGGNLIIPNTVSRIGCFAFSGTKIAGDLDIPDNVLSIDTGAFYGCVSIDDSVTLSTSIETISEMSFAFTSIKDIYIPDSVKIIENNAFSMCSNLKSIVGGNNVVTVGENVFLYMLYDTDKNIIIPETLLETDIQTTSTTLLNYDWAGDYRTIPNDVKFDGNYKGFESLFSLYPGSTDTYYYIDDEGTLWFYGNNSNLSSVPMIQYDNALTARDGVDVSLIKEVKFTYDCGVINIISAEDLFYDFTNCTKIDLSKFDTTNAVSLDGMFLSCDNLQSIDVSNFVTTNVEDMSQMFSHCKNLKTIDLSNFDTSNVTDMSYMFYNCYVLNNVDVSSFNTDNVTEMNGMFYDTEIITLDLANFNTSNVTDMSYMFGNCSNLTSLNISSFNTSKVESMYRMFQSCALSELDLSHFDFSGILDTSDFPDEDNVVDMLYSSKLMKVTLPEINLTLREDFIQDYYPWIYENDRTVNKAPLLVGSDTIAAGTYYKARELTINNSYSDTDTIDTTVVYVPEGQTILLEDVKKDNYKEPLLYTNEDYSNEYDMNSVVTNSKTLYALYSKVYILNSAKDLYGVLDTNGVLHVQGTGTELDRLLGGCIGLENAVSLKGIVFETDTIEIICNSWCSSYSTSTTVDGETVLVSTFENLTGDLILPKNLKSIGEKTFTDTTFNGSLYMPECITNIGSYAFYNTKFTSELNIPDSLTTIEDGVFGNTCFTGPLEIPTSVSTIGKYAFSDSKGFTGDLIIPNTVTEIGVAAFSHCEGFDGRLIIGTGLTKISKTCFAGMPNISGDLIIPENIKEIEAYAFYTNTEDSHKFEGGKLVLPSAITYIGNRTFDNCKFTGELNIPDEVETIGKEAFEKNCFTSLKLPSNLKTIDEYAFYKCNSIVGDLIIPNGVTSIGASAFSKSYSNDNGNYILNLPDSLIAVGRSAFSYNDFSGTLKIPKNLEIVEWGSFSSNNFDEIILGENTTTLCKYAFQANNISYIVIPDSITELQSKCFSACYDLEKIYIGNGLEIIEEGAFSRSGSQYKTKLLTENEVALTYNWENDNRIILPMNTFVIGVPQEISLKAKYPDVNGSPIWYSEFDMEIQGDFEDGSYGELGGVSSFTIFSEDGDSREVVTNIEDMRVDEDGTITIPITLKADNPTLIKEFSGNLNVSTVLHELFPTLDEAS